MTYYSGVVIGRTTICCSTLVLALICGARGTAQTGAKTSPPLSAQRIWTLPLDSGLTAPPRLSGARGYFPLDEGRLAGYDLAGGKRLWVAAAHAESRPAAGDNLVFVAESGAILALHDEDGTLAWRVTISERLAAPIVWGDGWLITVSLSGTISAYRAIDGHLIWQRESESTASAPPGLAADRVYIPSADGQVIALQVKTGAPLWARRLSGTPHEILALDDRLYVGATDNFFYCLSARDGRVRWRWRTGGDVIGLPVADEQRIYFVSLDNLLRGLDRNSGSQQWLRALPLRPNAGPVRAADMLIVSGISPRLPAYALRNGAPAGEIEAPGNLASPPHVFDANGSSTIVVVTRDIVKGAEITAFGPHTEKPLP